MRVTVCIFWFKGTSTSKVIGARNEMMMDDYDGQLIFGDLGGLKLPDIYLRPVLEYQIFGPNLW